MPRFKKCPRCDLNYIGADEQYCTICQEELRGISHILEEYDPTDIEIETDEGRLCPRCRISYLKEGETICSCCLAEQEADEKGDLISHSDDAFEPDDWGDSETIDDNIGEPGDDIADDDLELSLDELRDEEEGDEDEEDEYKDKDKKSDEDDFDFDDNLDDIADDEEEEEESSDDEDDDL